MATAAQLGATGDGLTDDTSALVAFMAQGGVLDLPPGRYLFDGPLEIPAGTTLTIRGTLAYRRGWASAYAICPTGFRQGKQTTSNVTIIFAGGSIEFVAGASTAPRKGIGMAYANGFLVEGATITGSLEGPEINLFAVECREARNGIIRVGTIRNPAPIAVQGADGIHLTDNCSDIEIVDMDILSGDDALSLTLEIDRGAPCTIERITARRCKLGNRAHAALKLLTTVPGVIRNIMLIDCDMATELSGGMGVPISIDTKGIGTIDQVAIYGGDNRVTAPDGMVGGTAALVAGATNVLIQQRAVEYYHRILLDASAVGTSIRRYEVNTLRAIGVVPPASIPVPLIRVLGNPSVIALPSGVTGYKGQALIG